MAKLIYSAIKAGLVDECHLLDVRSFGNGVVHLHYRTLT